mmetsp:Transcript_23483/g.65329  ORF Transcript_23483/g.65329 Transcript_23483/m.65329 type:complete len:236 (+) Transcript_23483:1575-2282(+)
MEMRLTFERLRLFLLGLIHLSHPLLLLMPLFSLDFFRHFSLVDFFENLGRCRSFLVYGNDRLVHKLRRLLVGNPFLIHVLGRLIDEIFQNFHGDFGFLLVRQRSRKFREGQWDFQHFVGRQIKIEHFLFHGLSKFVHDLCGRFGGDRRRRSRARLLRLFSAIAVGRRRWSTLRCCPRWRGPCGGRRGSEKVLIGSFLSGHQVGQEATASLFFSSGWCWCRLGFGLRLLGFQGTIG